MVGKISKQSSGFIKEFLVNAGNIAIQFPEDVSETVKALVLGACFLIVSLLLLILVRIHFLESL